MLSKRHTLQEIAAMAGVSVTTASMVLNGKARQHHIAKKTEEKILNLIQKEHFTPNVAAQAIVGGRTNLIGFVMRDEIDKSFWAEILAGTSQVLEKAGFHIILSFAINNKEKELQALDFLRTKRVDAYVLAPEDDLLSSPEAVKKLQEYNQECPLLLMTTSLDGMNSVAVNEEIGGKLAAQHLLTLGHSRIAAIGNVEAITPRIQHFCTYAQNNGANASIFPDISSFMPNLHDFTAAFCFSDNIAIQLMNKCIVQGIRIPEDFSIVGYDNQPISLLSFPKLTTIHQPKRSFGEQIGELLLHCINDVQQHTPEHILLTPELIVRESTTQLKY